MQTGNTIEPYIAGAGACAAVLVSRIKTVDRE